MAGARSTVGWGVGAGPVRPRFESTHLPNSFYHYPVTYEFTLFFSALVLHTVQKPTKTGGVTKNDSRIHRFNQFNQVNKYLCQCVYCMFVTIDEGNILSAENFYPRRPFTFLGMCHNRVFLRLQHNSLYFSSSLWVMKRNILYWVCSVQSEW